MPKPPARTVLYRLIEAGQLTHRALLALLRQRGLEAGDDALLLSLHEQPGATEAELGEQLGLDAGQLGHLLARLTDRELVLHDADGHLLLTERGTRFAASIIASWTGLEAELFGELEPKQRKALKKALGAIADRLR